MGKIDGDQLTSDNNLESWKEIASYLDKNVRTCQRWEKELGLPVHRLEGIDKSRVFAFKKEIDSWQSNHLYRRESQSPFLSAASASASASVPVPKHAWRVPLVTLLIVLTFVSLIISKLNKPIDEIADFWIDGGKITFLNIRYQPVGEFETGFPHLIEEKTYKARMFARNLDVIDGPLPFIQLIQTNKEGPQEVLVVVGPFHDESRTLCLLDRGQDERWRRIFGEDVGRPFGIAPEQFTITGFCCEDVNGDGRREIIVLLNEKGQSLCQISVLDYDTGDILATFIHPGAINDCLAWDPDGDGRKEILLAGLNMDKNRAFAAIMDFSLLAVAVAADATAADADADADADESGPSSYQNMEIFKSPYLRTYGLFPQNRFTKYINQYNKIIRIEVRDGENPQLLFKGNSIYYCTPDLTLDSIQYCLRLRMEHPKLVRQGLVSESLREVIEAEFDEGVLYFTDGEWARRPTSE